MASSGLSYGFTCPRCAGKFSIELERIPPVQARFPCPSCKEPMDFPSRDEARVYATLAQGVQPSGTGQPSAKAAVPSLDDTSSVAGPGEGKRFRIEKAGFETDVFDRRSLRNLIRAGEVNDHDRIRVDDAEPVLAGDIAYLKSLFSLRKTARITPPVCCRTHTDRVAFFKCNDTARPLCEECAPVKKFGQTSLRVCQHCGGTAADLVPA